MSLSGFMDPAVLSNDRFAAGSLHANCRRRPNICQDTVRSMHEEQLTMKDTK